MAVLQPLPADNSRGNKAVGWRPGRITSAILTYCILCAVSVFSVFPFLWMISTSLKEQSRALIIPPQWIPDPILFSNYTEVFRVLPFGTFYFNSFKITFLVLIGRLFVCALAGYGFARFEFPERDIYFAIMIGSLMIPAMVTFIPLYIGYNKIGWLNTHYPLIIPPILASTFGTFLMRQFVTTLPRELEEASRIDGASEFGIFWRIILPLSKPALAALAILTYMSTWNAFFEPLIFLSDMETFTVPLGLAFFQDEYATQYPLLMAGALGALIPILIVYCFTQRYFVQGIAMTGIRG